VLLSARVEPKIIEALTARFAAFSPQKSISDDTLYALRKLKEMKIPLGIISNRNVLSVVSHNFE
jgi:FMN phosphatase YigB (HAD superfamily)